MRGLSKAVSFCMMIGLLAQSLYIPAMAEEAATEIAAESDTDTSLVGTLAFAQCEEYINIRESASTDSAVTAKIYNNGSATIEGQDGDWYKIRSGNAEGYVMAEYFVTGEAADAVAQKAAYNVAMVHPTDLNIRSDANEDSEVLATAHEKDELEVVAWDGDWMKVALGGDVYGYVNAYYVDYKTYYPTAETIEEEQARLSAEQEAAEAADYEVSDDTAETLPEETCEEPTVDDSSDTEEASYPDDSDETTWTEAPATDETVWTEAPETEAPYTEAPETEAPYTEAPETEAPYTEAPAETEAPYTEAPETEAPYTEAPAETGGTVHRGAGNGSAGNRSAIYGSTGDRGAFDIWRWSADRGFCRAVCRQPICMGRDKSYRRGRLFRICTDRICKFRAVSVQNCRVPVLRRHIN